MKLSARNVLSGTVSSVKKGAVNTEVVIALKGGPSLAGVVGACGSDYRECREEPLSIVSVITNTSAESLALKAGAAASAIFKASSIIVGTDLGSAKVSARNIFNGKVVKVVEGPVSAEVDLDIGSGNTLVAVITAESAKKLGLKAGDSAYAMIKASSVIVGV